MRYGSSYYPEQKRKQDLDHDIQLMQQAGFNTVRMAEFAWPALEPVEGAYDFDWLDEAVDRMAQAGIDSIICTPTACPPAWMVEAHPEILYRDNRGVTRPFGGRRHYCYSNSIYRDYSERVAEKLGQHYGHHPHVIGFQIDNELAQEGTGRCHCEACQSSFRRWLEEKYVTINRLNERAGTAFWGQTYSHFGQIRLPVNTIEPSAIDSISAFYENPTLRLDFERFSSSSLTEYLTIQKNALRRFTDKSITTNATGLATNSVNYYTAFGDLDVYSFDYYPGLREERISSLPYAFARGVKKTTFWLLEFTSGGGHRLGGSGRLQPFPGALKQAVVHASLSGAELLLHYQFRTFPFGAEQLNYAIVDADGKPRRRFREVQETSAEIRAIEALGLAPVRNKVAICFDYETLWSLEIKPVNKGAFSYVEFCDEIYRSFSACGVGADVVSCDAALSGYDLVVLPTPFVMDESFKQRLGAYVRGGGVLVSTFLTAAKDRDNNAVEATLPAGLTELFGVEVSEVEPVFDETVSRIKIELGTKSLMGTNRAWTEVLKLTGAEAVGFYTDTFRNGAAVVSRNSYGAGVAYYLGTSIDSQPLATFFREVLIRETATAIPFEPTDGVEIIPHQSAEGRVYCLFNFTTREVTIPLTATYIDIRTRESLGRQLSIAPKAYVFVGPG